MGLFEGEMGVAPSAPAGSGGSGSSSGGDQSTSRKSSSQLVNSIISLFANDGGVAPSAPNNSVSGGSQLVNSIMPSLIPTTTTTSPLSLIPSPTAAIDPNQKIKISQDWYDMQKAALDGYKAQGIDFTGNFGPTDIRGNNWEIADYTPNANFINPITGKTESNGGYYYRTGSDGKAFVASDDERQRGIDTAKAQGYGDISDTYKPIDLKTWQYLDNFTKGNDAYQYASGENKDYSKIKFADGSTVDLSDLFDKRSKGIITSLVPNGIVYTDEAGGAFPTNPNGGYVYTDKDGVRHVVDDYRVALQFSGDGDIQEYNGKYGGGYGIDYDPNLVEPLTTSLAPDTELDAQIRAAGVDPATLTQQEKDELSRMIGGY